MSIWRRLGFPLRAATETSNFTLQRTTGSRRSPLAAERARWPHLRTADREAILPA